MKLSMQFSWVRTNILFLEYLIYLGHTVNKCCPKHQRLRTWYKETPVSFSK